MSTAQIDNYQVMCEKGREAAQSMDRGRWMLGDLACLVEKHYDKDLIADFAREVNVPKARIQSYRTVSRFYEQKSTRYDFLEVHKNITWTHMRLAMSIGDVESAYELLEECSAQGWTTDELAYHLSNRKSSEMDAPNSEIPSYTGRCEILSKNGDKVTLLLKSNVFSELSALVGKDITITIQELES